MGLLNGEKENKVIKQDLKEKAEFQNLFMVRLLFKEKPVKPQAPYIKKCLEEKFGEVEIISADELLTSFSINKYKVQYQDCMMPPQVLLMDVSEFDSSLIGDIQRSQLWNVDNPQELLDSCKYSLRISDMMAAGLYYKERCEMLMDYLEAAVEMFPDFSAVWIESSGKMFTAEQIRNHNIPREDRFVYFAVNARFFNIEVSGDMIVDTLGMYAVGLPDVQYHFHDLDPNDVVNHAYNTAAYIFENEAPIKSGETIDGLKNGVMSMDVQWKCAYEVSLIQPQRDIMDICPGEYASGTRE